MLCQLSVAGACVELSAGERGEIELYMRDPCATTQRKRLQRNRVLAPQQASLHLFAEDTPAIKIRVWGCAKQCHTLLPAPSQVCSGAGCP